MGTKRLLLYVLVGGLMVWGATGCNDDPAAPPAENTLVSCFNCHGDTPGSSTVSIAAIQAEYSNSLHATGSTWQRKSSPCLGCHTNEGFVQRVQTGEFPTTTLEHSSPIHCWTCHAPHTNGNFTFRTAAPVTFMAGNGTYDYGKSNLCANCHQSRPENPPVPTAATDSISITSSRWGPHYGTQSQMLSGQGGYFSTAHPAANTPHATLFKDRDGCVRCHMFDPPSSGLSGGHTWSMGTNYAACDECHTGTTTFDINGERTEIATLIASVEARLTSAGLLTATGSVAAGRRSADQAKAIYNYKMVVYDRSVGAHNALYARRMLESALDFVPAPAPKVAAD